MNIHTFFVMKLKEKTDLKKPDFLVKRDWLNDEDDSRKASFKIEYKNPRTGENYDYEYEF